MAKRLRVSTAGGDSIHPRSVAEDAPARAGAADALALEVPLLDLFPGDDTDDAAIASSAPRFIARRICSTARITTSTVSTPARFGSLRTAVVILLQTELSRDLVGMIVYPSEK